MNLGEFKEWVNRLPEDFDSFNVVNGEVGMLNDQFHYRVDKPIIACAVDEETQEIILLHQLGDELTEDDINVGDTTPE